MTIIDQDGLRRCDATCHGAKRGTECICICRGRYHGAGATAVDRLRQDLEQGSLGPELRRLVPRQERMEFA